HICGRDGEVLTNPDYPKGSLLGIYVIDKLGFLSNISNDQESLLRTHSICLKCKEKLVLGINVIEKHLSSKIDNVSVLIIPSLVKIDQKSEMKQLLEYCKNAFNTANSYETYSQIENIEDELMGRRLFVLVNLVFGQGRQSQFIYHATIQNVPPSRLILIGEKSRELAGETAVFFEEERDKWFIGLSDVKRLLPLRKLGNKTVLKPFIELVNAMLTESPYPKEQILKFALLYAKVHHFGNYEGYDIKRVDRRQRDVEMCKGLLKYVLLLNLLVKLGVIEMEEGLFPSLEGVNKEEIKDIIDFCRKQGYNEWQTGLFLLGVLIGKIGVEQYNKGDTKKAILEKIDFNGMHVDKLKWLVNIILEGLKNYRLLEWNEEIYAQAKLIIDRNISNLKDPIANTFYVLSGYAYATLKAIKGGGKSGNK
ncbi:MAG: type I-B CRISPR-associated protein Cas8b/Csh1, partial [Thermoproteota archaeon]